MLLKRLAASRRRRRELTKEALEGAGVERVAEDRGTMDMVRPCGGEEGGRGKKKKRRVDKRSRL